MRKRYNVGLEKRGLRNSKWYGLGSILYLLNLFQSKTALLDHFIAQFHKNNLILQINLI